MERQNALNLPSWWTGDVEEIESKLVRELKKRNFPSSGEKLLLSAVHIAKQYHRQQTRADGTKYIMHPYRVCLSLLMEFEETSVDLLLAALLHDILEDTNYTHREMRANFGETVRSLVDIVSRKKDEKRTKTGDNINGRYFQRIIENGADSIKLKIADKLDNIRDALNHPEPEKRRLYIRECQTVFLPLIKYLEDRVLQGKIQQLFEEAMLNHPSYLDQLLLFNPTLDYWLTSDNVHRVKLPLNSEFTAVDLVKSAAAAIINKIDSDQVDSLLYIANLPVFLNSPTKKSSWVRVRTQLNTLLELLSTDTAPQWLEPILETPEYLLSVIHSRLFMPANWLFPLWQKDYGDHILETNEELYLSLYEEKKEKSEKWIARLHLLLIHREALWRYVTGNGVYTAQIVFSEIKKQSNGLEKEYRFLVSMRLLSEYLDIRYDLSIPQGQVEDNFSELWKQLNNLDDKVFEGATEIVEIIGFGKVQDMYSDLKDQLSLLRSILMEYINKEITNKTATGKPPLVWVNFNIIEIEKRLTFFQEGLKKIGGNMTFEDFEKFGIQVQIDRLENILVFTIEPDKWDALKNRIPEITDKEREEIRVEKYSAVAIFDTLLKNKLEKAEKEPIWIPRVYRILDTMVDFDPFNVQQITISLQAEEKIKDVKVYLPIPEEPGDWKLQEKRKEITARYIVIIIYNYVVTLGIYSAVVDCSPLDERKHHLGFKIDELEKMISRFAKEFGYEQQYGTYLENFNFKKFSIKAALSPRGNIEFTGKDITAYGSFLGIDIGGTDIKVSLFRKGNMAFKKNQLLKFKTPGPTIGNHVPVEEFCRKIIEEVDSRFNNTRGKSKFHWEELDGIGISWPGAVRNSKIIGFSGTLQRLSFQKDDKTKTLHSESSPQDIHSIDLASVFYKEIQEKYKEIQKKLKNSFVITLENDGNAEAYGNYCHLIKNKKQAQIQFPRGKIIIKLGTSLAGGHVNAYGAISPYMAEFSKITLDFNIKGGDGSVQGAAREFVSSKGVRNLSRAFQFNGDSVFGELLCKCCHVAMNASDSQKTRVEAVEIGKMLNLFKHLDDELKAQFYQVLVETDNQPAAKTYEKTMKTLVTQLKKDEKMKQEIRQYIQERGEEEFIRLHRNSKTSKSNSLVWQLGISRLRLLLQLKPSSRSYETGQIPSDLDYKILAKKILGSVALLSQLGAHISHLIVALYNIYKKERFSEVILAGGVLSGETGPLVIRQAKSFLGKYYDKIFGLKKHLKPGSVRLAMAVKNPDTVGPFGAAMVANRFHKMNSLAVMEKEVDYRVRSLKPGDTLSLKDLEKTFQHLRINKEDILTYLETLISKSILLQQSTEKEVYVKALNHG
jgi:hypothetical protein